MEKQYELGQEVYVPVQSGTESPFIEKLIITGKKYKKGEDVNSGIIIYQCEYTGSGNNTHFRNTNEFVCGDIFDNAEQLLEIIERKIKEQEQDTRKELEKRKQELGIR